MTGSTPGSGRVLGSLHSSTGTGSARIQDHFDTDIDDLWSALTEPHRLARWLCEVTGELRLGGEFHAHFFATGWQGTNRVVVCEPPHRLLVLATEDGESDEHALEVTLTAHGEQTALVIEERGIPVDQLAAYGAGIQVHAEDLAAHLAGQDRCDAQQRWAELVPAYRDLTVSGS